MKLHIPILVLFLLVCSFISCKRDVKNVEYLNQACEIMSDNPEKALLLLDSIDPGQLGKRDYMHYIVQRVRAKYKCYQDIKDDTLIFEAKDYFENSDDSHAHKAYALYYCGCLYGERGNMEDALLYTIRALEHVPYIEDYRAPGIANSKLGDLYYDKNMEDSAVIRYKKALPHFRSPRDDKWLLHANQFIGLSYILLNQPDSALVYTNRGLRLARINNDSLYISMYLNSLGLINYEQGKYAEVKRVALEGLNFNAGFEYITLGLFTRLSKTYHHLHQPDSAVYYAEMALTELEKGHVTDNKAYLNVYDCLAFLNEEQGDYEKSLTYRKQWIDYREKELEQERKKEFSEIERKYQLWKKDEELLKMKNREQFYFAGIAVFILLTAALFFFRKYVEIQNRQMQQKNEIQALELKVQQREIEINKRDLRTKEAEMKNMVYVITIYKKLTSQMKDFEKEVDQVAMTYSVKRKTEEMVKGYQKIQISFKKMKSETQASLHEMAFNFLTDQKIDKNKIIQLSTSDMLFLSLLHCNYEPKDIAAILGVTLHALQMRKSRLKEKLGNLGISSRKVEDLFSNE